MTLDEFRRCKSLSLKGLGQQIGATESAMSRYCRGIMLPEKRNFALILAVCGGEVTAEALVREWLLADGAARVETPDGERTISELYEEYERARPGANGRPAPPPASGVAAPSGGVAFVCPYVS